ncbi:MAG: DUF58 domain-containing protein [Oscillospiraceae bacterium]
MKSLRIGYFITMAALFFAARLTARREFYLLLFMMAAVLLCALILNLWTILSFSFVQELSENSAVKGANPTLRVGIYNDKPFPFTMIRIRVEIPIPSEEAELRFNLSVRSRINFEIPLYCAYRGVYEVGMTTVEVGDVFGLLSITYDMRRLPYYRQRVLKVYPRLVSLRFLPSLQRDAKAPGSSAVRLSESGEAYSELREYRPGDSMKRIHWSASARKGELFAKRYELSEESAALVALDTRGGSYEGEELLRYADLACECAAAIAEYGARTGHPVELVVPDRPAPKAPERFRELYERLATMPFGKDGDLADKIDETAARIPNLRTVYVIASRQEEALDAVLRKLAGEGCAVKCLFVGARGEKAFDPSRLPGVRCASLVFGQEVAEVLAEL